MKRSSSPNNSPPSSPLPVIRNKRRQRQTQGSGGEKISRLSINSVLSNLSRDTERINNELLEIDPSPEFNEDEYLASQAARRPERAGGGEGSRGGVEFTRLSFLVEAPLLSVGCPLLDRSLVGGLRPGELTEVVGESSAGKTQFSLQAAVEAAVRGETVLYIVTEGAFPSVRLDQMVVARKVEEVEDVKDRILVMQARNLPHLLAVLGKEVVQAMEDHPGVSLVVVDSVASLVRSESGLRTGLERGGAVHQLGQRLLHLTGKHGVAVLAVNQVTGRVRDCQGEGLGRDQVASLGQTWAQYPNTRLWLTKTRYVVSRTASPVLQGLMVETRLRSLHVDWSCRMANSLTYFYVDTKGCHGVKIED